MKLDSLFRRRVYREVLGIETGDVILVWDPALGEWRACEILSLEPGDETTEATRAEFSAGHPLRLRDRLMRYELTLYTKSFEKRLGIGNRLLPVEPYGWQGMSGKVPQVHRYRKPVQ